MTTFRFKCYFCYCHDCCGYRIIVEYFLNCNIVIESAHVMMNVTSPGLHHLVDIISCVNVHLYFQVSMVQWFFSDEVGYVQSLVNLLLEE